MTTRRPSPRTNGFGRNLSRVSGEGGGGSRAGFTARVRFAIWGAFAESGVAPSPGDVARRLGADEVSVRAAWRRLREERWIVTGEDGVSILMAHPFSGVPTGHAFTSAGVRYEANCAWDALGIPAALGRGGTVRARCGHSGAPLRLEVAPDAGPEPCDWFFHSLLPASRWWDDIVFT